MLWAIPLDVFSVKNGHVNAKDENQEVREQCQQTQEMCQKIKYRK